MVEQQAPAPGPSVPTGSAGQGLCGVFGNCPELNVKGIFEDQGVLFSIALRLGLNRLGMPRGFWIPNFAPPRADNVYFCSEVTLARPTFRPQILLEI